jgi:uncharacterized protein YyaL (SSP411 family)
MSAFRFSPRPNRAHLIRWRPWGEEALREAQREDKPVLLSISAVWCHWCHVMDETSYSDPEVISLVNSLFIPIRVDTDRNPEVNLRYNMGGWPTTAFLTPQGDLIAGGTYLPPHHLKEALTRIARLYREQRTSLYKTAQEVKNRRLERLQKVAVGGSLSFSIVDQTARAVVALYDPFFGGLGLQPKFPMPDALHLLLDMYAHTRDPFWLPMVTTTLDAMRRGPLYDTVEGGFFRYATQRDWSQPHYEKMAEDQAALLRLYLRAWLFTDTPLYRETALGVISYVNARLFSPEMGVFWGSQDADEEYYARDAQGRGLVPAPLVDRTVYTPWNAHMALAFVEAGDLLGQPALRQQGLGALAFLWDHLCREGGQEVFHCWAEGQPLTPGTVADYAWLALAFAEAYRRTGEGEWRGRAEAVAGAMLKRFWDPQGGAFWDISPHVAPLGYLEVKEKPLADNAVAAGALRLLASLTGGPDYARRAHEALTAFASVFQDYGAHAAPYARETLRHLFPPIEVNVVGPAGAPETHALLRAAFSLPYPCVEPLWIDGGKPEGVAARGFSPGERPQAYVCFQGLCLPPVDDPHRLVEAVAPLLGARGAGG